MGFDAQRTGVVWSGAGPSTHKGFRPEICGTSAFTIFATPAFFTVTNHGKLNAEDAVSRKRYRAAPALYDMCYSPSAPKVRPVYPKVRGTQQANRHRGGGAEVILENGSPARTLFHKDQIPPGNGSDR